MEELVIIRKDEAVCSSLQISNMFKKNHQHILRDIDKLTVQNRTVKNMFQESSYKAENGQVYRMYYLNRDGFSLLVMGFTGKKALEWKLKYIQAFNEMERQLKEKQSIQWQQTRIECKKVRKLETAEIKELVQYAQAQGSKNAKKYYLALSKLANKTIGLSGGQREQASVTQLNILTLVENIIHHVIQEGIEKQLPYKEIYQICKARLEQFRKITYLG